jgi:microcystin degradation protein MlrC
MKLRHIPILAQTIETSSEPHVGLLEKVHQYEENPKVINVAVMHGFPLSDILDSTMSVMAITDDDAKLAESIVYTLTDTIWKQRDRFLKNYLSPDEAVAEALKTPSGPVVIADAADNPGGGGSGDSTFILRALLKARARDVAFAIIPDPESVKQSIDAGVGSQVNLRLGGKLGPREVTGGPLEITAKVKTIADGLFYNKGPMMKGILNNTGRTVVVDVDGIEVVVTERRMQPFDAEIFRRVGIEPSEKKVIVLKSAVHFRASFGPLAKRIINVDTPAYHTMNFPTLNFKNVVRPVYPLDKGFEYRI